MADHDTLKEKVEKILEMYPESRNDDRYLWLLLIREFYPCGSKYISFIPYDVLKKLPTFESVTRLRREIQNDEGRFPPNEAVRKRRGMKETEYHNYYADKKSRK